MPDIEPQEFLPPDEMDALRRDMQSAIAVDTKTLSVQSRAADLRNFVTYLYAQGHQVLNVDESSQYDLVFLDETEMGPIIDRYLGG